MSDLYYNIYENLSNGQFLKIRENLIPLELQMLSLTQHENWKLHNSVKKSDALAIDLIKKDDFFKGNLGIMIEDKPYVEHYSFYITKSFDENKQRYFIRDYIFENEPFLYFENKISDLTMLALNKYNKISKKELKKKGEKFEIYTP